MFLFFLDGYNQIDPLEGHVFPVSGNTKSLFVNFKKIKDSRLIKVWDKLYCTNASEK